MKIVFLSNYYTHHQKPLCEALHKLTKNSFLFVETEEFSHERKKIGWKKNEGVSFVKRDNEMNDENKKSIINESDVVILGSAPLSMIKERLNNKKITFKYSERIYKRGYDYKKWLPRLIRFWWFYGRHKSLYLLTASAYTPVDYAMHGTFIGKAYKWGYFPETKHYDVDKLFYKKKKNKILWCGRFIDWKHPDDAIEIAKRLKKEGYSFELEFIGSGSLESQLRDNVDEYDLSDCVSFLGTMDPEQVRMRMEDSGIYIFTSDFQEGWGAVLNESMNSGCAVVASHAIGSVPFLLKHGENGFIYENGNINALYKYVKFLLDNPIEQRRLGENAYDTIVNLWNAEIAADRLIKMTEEIKDHGYCDIFEDGPCSKAKIIRNNWFKAGKT